MEDRLSIICSANSSFKQGQKLTMEQHQIVTVTVDELDFRRNFYIIYHREKLLTTSAHKFLDLCRNYEMDYPLNINFMN